MAISKEKAYYKALARGIAAVNSVLPQKEILKTLVRSSAAAIKARVSILTLDTEKSRLTHRSTWGLPHPFLHKGLLDAGTSLGEVHSGEPVIITDVKNDKRIQYPSQASEADIVSLAGIPIKKENIVLGSLRIYTRKQYDFSSQDIKFLKTMAALIGTVLCCMENPLRLYESKVEQAKIDDNVKVLQKGLTVNFAHSSEREFADILDFYQIDWVYEPRSFALKWEGDRVTRMFTPDFYLPKLDLYVELTTMKQRLVTEKNRKLRRLKQLYPDINITLLYKKDFDRLLAKYGHGPLAQSRAHGIQRILYSEEEIEERVKSLARQISADYNGYRPVMVGIQRGFLCFMADLMRQITVPLDIDFMAISDYGGDRHILKITRDLDLNIAGRHVLIVEDIIDTGMTLSYLLGHLEAKGPAGIQICTLFNRPARRIADIALDYVGFEIPDEFIVGYGLDYQEEYRNLPFVGVVKLGKGSVWTRIKRHKKSPK